MTEPSPRGPGLVAENSLPVDGRVYGVAGVDRGFVLRTDRESWRISWPD